MAATVAEWDQDRRWAYSITFDEALADLHRHATPLLRAAGVPGMPRSWSASSGSCEVAGRNRA